MAHCLETLWFIGLRCGGSLLEYVVAHCLFEMVAHCLNMWWLIDWICGGSLLEYVVPHCLEMWGDHWCRVIDEKIRLNLIGTAGAHLDPRQL